MDTDSGDLDICRGAENFPIYFVCDGKRGQLNNKEVFNLTPLGPREISFILLSFNRQCCTASQTLRIEKKNTL